MSTTSTQGGGPCGSTPLKCQQATLEPSYFQGGSQFFNKFPGEIRYMIYDQVFTNTRITRGIRYDPRVLQGSLFKVKPAPHTLALLRTCRRARDEIGKRWVRKVLLNFQDPLTMTHTLSPLPQEIISQIRHIRVYVELQAAPDDSQYLELYNVVTALRMLPGLNLDILTVLVADLPHNWTYLLLDTLIRSASGWKELQFLTPTSEPLGHNDHEDKACLRQPQPSTWQSVLEHQDGVESHPSVVVYRAKEPFGANKPNKTGFTEEPSLWQPYEQKDTRDDMDTEDEEDLADFFGFEKPEFYGEECDENIMLTAGERYKEMAVIARRGKGANCLDDQNFGTWTVQGFRDYAMGLLEERRHWTYEDEARIVQDRYSNHVDEFEWPKIDFPWQARASSTRNRLQ
ncbi:hypothetical protein V8F20_012048 [Naviculisporaceae sp. PSN 640]